MVWLLVDATCKSFCRIGYKFRKQIALSTSSGDALFEKFLNLTGVSDVHPDVINDFMDAVVDFIEVVCVH